MRVLSRLAMSLLASRNPAAAGRISDDGFEMGRVTLAGSGNLALVGIGVGVVGWLTYLVVAASLVVHPDGIDFTVLGPLWLTVGLFVVVPATYGPLLHAAMLRVGGTPLGAGLADRAPALA